MSNGYNPNRNPAGTSEGGRFASGDSMRDEAGQIDAFGDTYEDAPGQDSAIGDVISTSKVFHHPDGDVRITVHRWVEATTNKVPFGPSEHANAIYDQYGEDADYSMPVDGIDYQQAEAVTVETPGQPPVTTYSSSVSTVDSPSDLDNDIDWDDYYDPEDYDREVELGLKGAIDQPRYMLGSEGEPEAEAWSQQAAEQSTVDYTPDGNLTLRRNNRSITVASAGVHASHALFAATAEARKVETTMHSEDWGDDAEYIDAVRRARRLRSFMGDDYERVVCGGEASTL